MKKTQKQLLGFFGLGAVVAMTAVAIALPSPAANALSSVTDTIIVRVVGETPNVNVTGIESGSEFLDADKDVTVTYENVDHIVVTLKYTDLDENEHEVVLKDDYVNYVPGQEDLHLNLRGPEFGYGNYVLTVRGTGSDGVTDEDIIEFTRSPFTADLEEEEDSGKTYVDLDYSPDEEGEIDEGEIEKFIIEVYDKDGNLISPLSPIEVPSPEKQVELPFDDYDLESGKYTIKITAYDKNDKTLSIRYLYKDYDSGKDIPVPDTNAPDTGGLFKSLNISQSDFMITGLLIFFMVGIAGIVFVAKKDKKNSRRR